MTTFDKREESFEKKFAIDEELRFKATARRNKLLGLWAAQKLGLSGTEADAYAKEVVLADLEETGDDDVFRKIRKDFDAKGVKDSDHQIRRTMEEALANALPASTNSGTGNPRSGLDPEEPCRHIRASECSAPRTRSPFSLRSTASPVAEASSAAGLQVVQRKGFL